MDPRFSMEIAAFDQKIALAELEKAKAEERVKELVYQRASFQMDWMKMVAKAQQEQAKNAPGPK